MAPDIPRFAYGAYVYHKTCGDEVGLVTGLIYRPTGLLYEVTWGRGDTSPHHEIELTLEQPALRETEEG